MTETPLETGPGEPDPDSQPIPVPDDPASEEPDAGDDTVESPMPNSQ